MKTKKGFWGALLFGILLIAIAVTMIVILADRTTAESSDDHLHDVGMPEKEDGCLISTEHLKVDIEPF